MQGRAQGLGAAVLACTLWAAAGWAQTDGSVVAPSIGVVSASAILTLDQDRMFTQSAYGKAVLARATAADAALAAENRRIEAGLEQEERDLTERRTKMPPDEFANAANAFDAKVEAIRTAQDAKSRDITQQRDADQQRFVQAAGPVLGALMTETGAVAIIDKSVLILSLNSIDITDQAVVRLDAVLGDGTAAADPDPSPQPPPVAPEPAPAP